MQTVGLVSCDLCQNVETGHSQVNQSGCNKGVRGSRENEKEKALEKTVTNTQIRVHTSTAGTCPAYLSKSKREARTLLHFGCHRSFFMLPARSQGPLAGEGDWHRTNVIIDWCSPKFMDDLNADESSI